MIIDFDDLDYDQARAQKDALDSMLESPGWEIVKGFIAARTQMRLNELTGYRIENQEHVARYNYLQGEMQELARFPEIIAQYCSDLAVELRKLQDEEQAELDLSLDRS